MARKSETVLALDPGERTGWAAGRMSYDRLELLESGVLRWDMMEEKIAKWQHVGYFGAYEELYTTDDKRFDVIVAESWKPRRDARGKMDWIEGDELTPAKHIGGIRFIARTSRTRYLEQSPKEKPTSRASYPLSLAEVDEESNEQHDQDARLHLWLYFFTNWFTTKVGTDKVIYLPS